MASYIGVDIGGTNIAYGLIDEQHQVVKFAKFPTEVERGPQAIMQTLAAKLQEWVKESNESGNPICGIGVGIPGFVDHERGIVENAVNLGWVNIHFAAEMQKLLNLPIYINNDVRMYVYGEAIAGAGQGFKHVFGLTLGTGLAAAMVNNGQLHYGSGNRAGEFGHIRMEGNTYHCACGLTGCLETIASANGIARQAKDAITAGEQSILQEWFPGEELHKLTAKDVSRAYDVGDSVAQHVMLHTASMLAKGLAMAVTLLSPDIIVIGGGASLAGERLLAPMRELLKSLVLPAYWEGLTIRIAQRIDDAGIIGSALYAKERISNS